MKTLRTLTLATFALASFAGAQMASMDNNPMVGGMAMSRSKTIVENAMNSKAHTTLVAAVKAAGLAGALMGKGPFTVFAPTDDAFMKLPSGTVDSLMMAENKAKLRTVLKYHVAEGRWTYETLKKEIMAGKGTFEFKTLSGGRLWAMMNGPQNIVVKDEMGRVASISTYDVMQSNGVIHVIDTVLMPKG